MLGLVLIIGNSGNQKVMGKSWYCVLNDLFNPSSSIKCLTLTTASEEKDVPQNGSPATTKKTRNKKQGDNEIEFTISLDKKIADIFAPPKNPKSLLLPANRAARNTRLPEDCHYQPENLVKLFLLPNVMVICYKCHAIQLSPLFAMFIMLMENISSS